VIYGNGELWQNDTDKRKPKKSEKNQSQCHFVHDKSHMDLSRCEQRPPRTIKFKRPFPTLAKKGRVQL
jgi:hypothetical protein